MPEQNQNTGLASKVNEWYNRVLISATMVSSGFSIYDGFRGIQEKDAGYLANSLWLLASATLTGVGYYLRNHYRNNNQR